MGNMTVDRDYAACTQISGTDNILIVGSSNSVARLVTKTSKLYFGQYCACHFSFGSLNFIELFVFTVIFCSKQCTVAVN